MAWSEESTRYAFLMSWGRHYSDRFLRYCLPSMLAPGNLPAMPKGRCVVFLMTGSFDARVLHGSAVVQRLREIMPVRMLLVDDLDFTSSYAAMTACYNRGMRLCGDRDTAFVSRRIGSWRTDRSRRCIVL